MVGQKKLRRENGSINVVSLLGECEEVTWLKFQNLWPWPELNSISLHI
jgi:hypothetical protein